MYALLRWWKSPARAAGYDYSSRDLDHNFHSHGASNARGASSRRATRNLEDDDSDNSLCDRGYAGAVVVVDDDKGKQRAASVSASVSVNTEGGLDDTEGIPLEERSRSVASVR